MKRHDKIGRNSVLGFTVLFFLISVYTFFSIKEENDIESFREILYASSFSIILLFCWYLEVKPIEEERKKEKEERKRKFRNAYQYLIDKEIQKIKEKEDD